MNKETYKVNKVTIIISILLLTYIFWKVSLTFIYRTKNINFLKCRSNCRSIGKALEKYAENNNDQFPDRLSDLVSGYLERIPQCPSSKNNSYVKSYQVSSDKRTFSVYCAGKNHTDLFPSRIENLVTDQPGYYSIYGLIERSDDREKLKPVDTFYHFLSAKRSLFVIKRLLKKHPEVLEEKYHGNTLLHLAAKEGRRDVAEFLISKGLDVNALNRLDKTPLDLAEKGDVIELLKYEMNKK